MIYLTAKYASFAAIATAVNISTQYISMKMYNGDYKLYIAILFGTLTGLIVKYLLDKKYIFYYNSENKRDDFQKFILYSLMGIVTTFVFWGTELSFNYIFDFDTAKYIGAAIGLTIGYISKYFLDKKFVFNEVT